MRWLMLLWLWACQTTKVVAEPSPVVTSMAPQAALPAEALYPVCWAFDAPSAAKVTLHFAAQGVQFVAEDGAGNGTGRCLREVAETVPPEKRPAQPVVLTAPTARLSGWAVLAWVDLLASGRFGPDRGILRPSAAAAACLRHGPVRADAEFSVSHEPAFAVRVSGGSTGPAERCLEAVLSATAWPSTRSLRFFFAGPSPVTPGVLLGRYAGPTTPLNSALAPEAVKESLSTQSAAVGQCFEQLLARRPTAQGPRAVRFRVEQRKVTAWVGPGDVGPQLADALLDACLIQAVERAPWNADGEGVYTWRFAQR